MGFCFVDIGHHQFTIADLVRTGLGSTGTSGGSSNRQVGRFFCFGRWRFAISGWTDPIRWKVVSDQSAERMGHYQEVDSSSTDGATVKGGTSAGGGDLGDTVSQASANPCRSCTKIPLAVCTSAAGCTRPPDHLPAAPYSHLPIASLPSLSIAIVAKGAEMRNREIITAITAAERRLQGWECPAG